MTTDASTVSPEGRLTANSKGEHSFASRVLACVSDIPPGRVMSYGGVATAIGSRAPRAVGRVLARSDHPVPWHRVVRSDGTLASALRNRQSRLLADEGVPMEGDRVVMEWAEWSVPLATRYSAALSGFQDASETGMQRRPPS